MVILHTRGIDLSSVPERRVSPRLSYAGIPTDISDALVLTPLGVDVRDRIAKIQKKRYNNTFGIELVSGFLPPPNSGAHGITQNVALPADPFHVRTSVSDADFSPPDRMYAFSRKELLNIVTCHELRHVLVDRTNIEFLVEDVPDSPIHAPGHLPAFEIEFKARIEFSIFNAASAPKSDWLSRYEQLFVLFSAVSDGAAFCVQLYFDVIKKLARTNLRTYAPYPAIQPSILEHIRDNRSSLIQPANAYSLVP